MPRTAIVETATGRILTLDPPTRLVPVFQETAIEEEQMALVEIGTREEVILPEGVVCEVVTLSDREAAKLATPDSRFTVRSGRVIVEHVPVPVAETARAEVRRADLAAIAERAKEDGAFASLARVLGVPVG